MRKIKENVFSVGAIDWDRRLFDELIPLPDGTTYNAYIVQGREKTVLIDTVDPSKQEVLIENLKELKIKKIDYIVANHAEQDHSGAIPEVLKSYPASKVVASVRCRAILADLLLIPDDRFVAVEDSGTISLGGKTLEFILAPWVHWPETMLTYLREDKILFPCDLFGSHLAGSNLYATDKAKVYGSAKRYYAEIMMPFRTSIKNHIEKLKNYEIEIIAPSHGPVYDEPDFIVSAYKDWVSDRVKNEVVIPYVSAHGSVKKMVDCFVEALLKREITVKPFNLSVTDIGELAVALVDAATLVIGTPTILTGAHPAAVYAAILANVLRPKTKFASIIGSYSWGGRMPEQIKSLIPNLKVEFLEPVISKGHPTGNDFKAIKDLASKIAEKQKTLGP